MKKQGRIVSQPGLDRLWSLSRHEFRLASVWSWVVHHRLALIVGLGLFFRVAQYLADRVPWMDEGSLATNLEVGSPLKLLGPLRSTQLAPPGFLVVEWAVRRGLGSSYYVLRLFPLIGGVASLFLFHQVARRCLRPTASTVALALFATSDDLIYFASELKQYSTDVTAALACTLAGLLCLERPMTSRRFLVLGAVGTISVWFSHPSAFVLAGVGTTLIASALRRKQLRQAVAFALVSLAWLVSFACVYAISRFQLGDQGAMDAFWGFAFPPVPPGSLRDFAWWPRRLAYLFVNPLGFNTPFGWTIGVVPALVYCLVGVVWFSRREQERTRAGMLALPIAFTIGATMLHRYPFHGRLVLFLVPSLLIFIAEGACRLGEWSGRKSVWIIILASILFFPTLRDIYHVAAPRNRDFFNPVGDRDPYRINPARFPF